jgi:hypothetical protein
MWAHTVDYRTRDRIPGERPPRWPLLNRGYFIHGLPRLILLCRLFGHRPVVDGVDSGDRWVCCDRCGVRGNPQGDLDPRLWRPGWAYTGPWAPPGSRTDKRPTDRRGWQRRPGPIDRAPTGVLGAEVIVGGNRLSGVGFEVKVGNRSSEHTLAASLHAGWLGALYLHTEQFGSGLQRRLNPVGYDSRVCGLRFCDGQLRWKVWSKRDSIGRADGEPWWRHGTLDLRLRDRLLGPLRYTYTDVPDGKVSRVVRMPEGDYLVELTLQRCTLGRRRGRKTLSWMVDWSALGPGIPTKGPQRGRVYGSGVTVPGRSVHAGTWPAEAVAAIAARTTADRTSHGWEPTGQVPIGVGP